MSYFKADSWAQVPMEYKAKSDFAFIEEEVKYGKYPTRKFRCIKQPAFESADRWIGDLGASSYEGVLKTRIAPGTVVFTGPTVSAEEPTNVLVTDDGKDFIVIGEGDHHFEVRSATDGPHGYKLTVKPAEIVYEDEDTLEIKDVDLSATLVGNHLIVALGLEDSVQAEAEVGDGDEIKVKFIKHGAFGNEWEVIIDIDNEVVRPLNVEVDESNKVLSIELATGEVADDPATVTIETREGGEPAPSFSVTAAAGEVFDGIEGNGILVRFVEDSSEGGLTTVWNSENVSIDIDFGGLTTASALDIANAISDIEVESETVFVGAQVNAGNFVKASDLDPDEYGMFTHGNLAGGTNELDAAENVRGNVKDLIEAIEINDTQVWEVDLDGKEGAFTIADEGTYEFEDGEDGGELDDTKNTLLTLHAAIDLIDAFDCQIIQGTNTTVVDADDLRDAELFRTYLLRGATPAGFVNRETGAFDVDFDAVTVLDPFVNYGFYKYGNLQIDNPSLIAEAHPEYSIVYVDLRGEGRIIHKTMECMR